MVDHLIMLLIGGCIGYVFNHLVIALVEPKKVYVRDMYYSILACKTYVYNRRVV